MPLLKKLLAFFDRRNRLVAGGLFVLMLVAALLEAFSAAIIMPFIAMVQDPSILARSASAQRAQELFGIRDSRTLLEASALILILLFLIKPLYLGFVYQTQFRFAFRLHAQLARRLLTNYLATPYLRHLARNSSDAIRNLNVEVSQVVVQVVLPLFMLTIEGLVAICMVGTLLFFEPIAALSALALLGCGGGVFYYLIRKRAETVGERKMRLTAEMIRWVNQSFGGFKEVKAHGAEAYFIDVFDQASQGYSRAMRYSRMLSELPRLGIEAVTMIGLFVIVLILLAKDYEGARLFPIVAVFGMAGIRLMPSANRIITAIGSLRYNIASVETLWKDLRSEGLEAVSQSGETRSLFSDSIEIQGVAFAYPGTNREALTAVDLRIQKGEWIALVGASGSGKTTLADILLGLLQPSSGQVLVDGRPIAGVERQWRSQIGYIPQPTYLLDDTIRANVAFGVPKQEIDDERVWESLRAASLDEFVRSLPGELETTLGEFGSRLSGGQRQRIGIARALYSDPALLVLDEATSALDNETERSIRDTLRRFKGQRTIVTIAHRLASVSGCDRIVVLRDGRVVDEGSFERLSQDSLEFARIAGSATPGGAPA